VGLVLCSKRYVMTHTYTINGTTCNGCRANVQQRLSGVKGVKTVDVNLETREAIINMESHVQTRALQAALQPNDHHTIEEDALMIGMSAAMLATLL
jgi:copper chaperone CopZ